jgi:hypothetical protein
MFALIYARIVRLSHYLGPLPRLIILNFGVVLTDGDQNDCEERYREQHQ